MRWAALWALALSGCGLSHRSVKLFAPEDFVYGDTAPEPAIRIEIADQEGGMAPLQRPVMVDAQGGELYRPAVVTEKDTLVLSPTSESVRVAFWIRGTGAFDRHDFRPIRSLTGTLPRRFANELRFLPGDQPLDGPLRLPIHQLSSPFNAYSFADGDVLLIEARSADGPTQRTLLLKRDVGVGFGGFAGILLTVPTGNGGAVTPILAAGPVLSIRTRRAVGLGRALDRVEFVTSAGIGSTAIQGVSLDPEVSGVFNSVLAGGGVRLFGVLTVQGFVNTSSFYRDALETPATLAVGLDATGLTKLTRDAWSRAIREYPLEPVTSQPAPRYSPHEP